MKIRTLFAAILLFGVPFSRGIAADAVQIQTRVIESSADKLPFPGKEFSFLLQKSGSSSSCVAGVLTPELSRKAANLGKKLPDITLRSGQKGTVLVLENKACSQCGTQSADLKDKVGMSCTYLPKIRGGHIDLNLDFQERQFVGYAKPELVAKQPGKLAARITAELKKNGDKAVAVYAMKDIHTDVRLENGQTLVIFVEKTKTGRKYLTVTAQTVPAAR